eukprot:CAMPEP_0119330220 /NCGR_PEP_ID=MMETSP1333-20130426/77787_1 /TAXON_ID=418940 /ORGANISM="Scyphosphaera apsteinii, Strain RCC1455" /LENGTH=436 /DNA_ID=CAMNT_0007339563 /DNA_START=19 /DNA_END=1331 /DNA_ORIENTATION=+
MATARGEGLPYLNSHIVLISKSDIRYEGTLYTIDTTNSTVALQNVRSFGTEDRKKENPIPPSPEVFDYIIFRGTDIKDLHVCETPAEPPAAPTSEAPPTSAAPAEPVAVSEPLALPPPAAAAPAQIAPAWGANPSQARSTVAQPPALAPPAATSVPRAGASKPGDQRKPQPGTGAHMSRRASRGVNGASVVPDDANFDFQKMLAGFDKMMMMQEARQVVKDHSSKYNKESSFFDTLDEEIEEEGGKKGGRAFMAEMRAVDAQTFGEELIENVAEESDVGVDEVVVVADEAAAAVATRISLPERQRLSVVQVGKAVNARGVTVAVAMRVAELGVVVVKVVHVEAKAAAEAAIVVMAVAALVVKARRDVVVEAAVGAAAAVGEAPTTMLRLLGRVASSPPRHDENMAAQGGDKVIQRPLTLVDIYTNLCNLQSILEEC